MANENIQMMYWHALGGGLACLIPALFEYYNSLMPDFRENARKLFGCRGIFIPAGTTPAGGLPSQVVPVILNWTGAAGWLAQHFYQYWLYTGDDCFLKDKALPFMREAALFYEDFLVEGKDGYLKVYPSVRRRIRRVTMSPGRLWVIPCRRRQRHDGFRHHQEHYRT